MVNVLLLVVFLFLVHINVVFGTVRLKNHKGISFLTIKSSHGSSHRVSICDKKGRARDSGWRKCSSYRSCEWCVACDAYCSWCAIGGMCTRFCEGEDGSDCKSNDCARKSEYKCMTMAESHSSGVDYQTEGGIDLKMSKMMKKATLRGIEGARKVRSFSPFSYYAEEPERQDNVNT